MPSDAKQAMSATPPWVDAFADEMKAKLAQNRHKGDRNGWSIESAEWLLDKLKAEVVELEQAIKGRGRCGCREAGCDHSIARYAESVRITGECADVANFAMMIADVAGGLTPHERRP